MEKINTLGYTIRVTEIHGFKGRTFMSMGYFRTMSIIAVAVGALITLHPATAHAQRDLTVHTVGPCQLVQSDGGINASIGGWVRGLCDATELTSINNQPIARGQHFVPINADELIGAAGTPQAHIRELVIGELEGFTPLIVARQVGGKKITLVSYKDIPCVEPGRKPIMLNYGRVPTGQVSLLNQGDGALQGFFMGAACRITSKN